MTDSAKAPLPVQRRAWDTREKILAAAVECLAEDGYGATTTSRIQERSGVSRGSLLHQFPSRDDLLIAAVEHLANIRIREAGDRVAARERDADDIDAAVEVVWETFRGPLFRASLELWVAAKSNPNLARALAPHEHEVGRSIRHAVTIIFGPRLAARKQFGDLITLLLSSMRGTALTYTFEPRPHGEEPALTIWKKLAHTMLR
ncbi:MAG TPA: TetR/AcrR family transcriptional regulator [Amycolatopsis sp.]|nr:TetR/AcrR family transcriptional regulator [Amycolatopsis sp.]